ncbi:MAG: hypothetical protein KME48_02765 [Candidatus Thiodiazotropha sp. (ex Ctena orbiculata)]|uniref:Cyclophilin TM1367-like domain-containing protein n=1 Tax=Candidatus Thiodiazotropha taylori TaxID=2792791 RepID=A0A944M609_9GAMM|nr:hypothetical protein [Candidatus Thiodiazotropha taylori]MBT3058006.1 hypothetical protein [Candidatus Thiodiazotropha sp. (ex Lucina pensylvanica)]PUB88075.1 MAG: hypothetical protein DBP00_07560 [gamma proteobacterium symbiont of Ctena orbiculata]MBT3026067.1 hypothetical protein [Candidatus Thiodiazotropha taylori]MBT3033460.1 hypothetical protein [Candidatus Thiodiazotropha taylori]
MTTAKIRISWPSGEVTAELADTPTTRKLFEVLPYEGSANTWDDEVYFSVPFDAEREPNATSVVEKGTVCFWLGGSAIALLFGRTPASQGDECRLISDANIMGKVEGDPTLLRSVQSGDLVHLEAL